jgi:hypothetical protein
MGRQNLAKPISLRVSPSVRKKVKKLSDETTLLQAQIFDLILQAGCEALDEIKDEVVTFPLPLKFTLSKKNNYKENTENADDKSSKPLKVKLEEDELEEDELEEDEIIDSKYLPPDSDITDLDLTTVTDEMKALYFARKIIKINSEYHPDEILKIFHSTKVLKYYGLAFNKYQLHKLFRVSRTAVESFISSQNINAITEATEAIPGKPGGCYKIETVGKPGDYFKIDDVLDKLVQDAEFENILKADRGLKFCSSNSIAQKLGLSRHIILNKIMDDEIKPVRYFEKNLYCISAFTF